MEHIINNIAKGAVSPNGRVAFYQDNEIVRLTNLELDNMASKCAAWLDSLGLKENDCIGILARNGLEWILLDLAALKLKLMTAGFDYNNFKPDAELLIKYNLKYLFTDQCNGMSNIIHIKRILPILDQQIVNFKNNSYSYDDATTIKFTSGSTGIPKGLAATVGSTNSSISAVQSIMHHTNEDKLFVFLPLSLFQQRYWLYSALYYGHDLVISNYEFSYYSMKKEKPTVIMGVPSFFDTLVQDTTKKIARNIKNGVSPNDLIAITKEYAHSQFGGNIRYLWTGSAPAKTSMLHFYSNIGMAIYEGYGMNETCIVSKNYPGANMPGSVGKLLDGKSVYFDERRVLIVKSRYPVNTRYMYCAAGETEKVFTENADVITGDIGHIDTQGYLYIKGRYDDIVSLANGKNVFVKNIEDMVKQNPDISECVLFGAGQSHLVAVLSPSTTNINTDSLKKHIKKINETLGKDEKINNYFVVQEPFSIENGLLSSQYKPKRKAIYTEYDKVINRMYK
jgi:long-subunit acyl-CoA synthetase (AMP-forming)